MLYRARCTVEILVFFVMAMANREKSWVIEIQNQMKNVDPSAEINLWRKHSIYMVPACIKDLNSKAYKPQVVSFGPYHNGNPELTPMEEHKHRALLHFLKRAEKPFDDFVSSMEEVVKELQDAYQSLDDKWKQDRDEFMRLMIVDGCFMLEILRIGTGRPSDYAFNDPIFSTHGMLYTVPYIKRDMLMIENQVPLLVLEKLVSVESGKAPNDDQINKLVLKFCAPNARPLPPGVGLGLHVVDIFRKSLLQSPAHHEQVRYRHRVRPDEMTGGSAIIRSAMELNEAGIRFKKSRTTSLRDIRFSHGILSLPVIVVDDATEYMFLNLMAFERLHVGAGNEVTSYVFFMDNIIDSAMDVSLLHEKGIIQNAVGSDKAVAKLFNKLSKDVTLDPESSLDEVHMKVHAYCKKRWNKWRADVIHTYFRSPWALLSLAAAIFLLVMTVAQTFYTIYGYYVPYESGDTAPSPN